MQQPKAFFISGLVGIWFLGLGLFVAFNPSFGKPALDNARASETWPDVGGVVEHSEVFGIRDEQANGSTYSYSVRVVFAYSVEGREYSSDSIGFGSDREYSTKSEAAAVADQYGVGKAVTVTYDPEQPEVAVLEPGATGVSSTPFYFGLLLVGLGAFNLLRMAARVLR